MTLAYICPGFEKRSPLLASAEERRQPRRNLHALPGGVRAGDDPKGSWLGDTLQGPFAQGLGREITLDHPPCRVAERKAVDRGLSLHASGNVRRLAHRDTTLTIACSDRPHHHPPGVGAEPNC